MLDVYAKLIRKLALNMLGPEEEDDEDSGGGGGNPP